LNQIKKKGDGAPKPFSKGYPDMTGYDTENALNDLSEAKFKASSKEIIEERSSKKCCIIYPYWKNKENYCKTTWDIFVAFCIILQLFSTPIDLAFPQIPYF